MPSTLTTALAAAIFALCATQSSGHIMMATPTPYGKSSLDNSPLSSGTDYPCKQRSGVYKDEGARAKNTIGAGTTQQLSFIGSASHGGGSCQISLTADKEPTKSSKFAVIKSFEGGCPGGANGGTTATFEYSIPNSVAPGDYTLAWTWFNKIGNREMYMNCAPITVTGGSKKRDVNATEYDALADSVFGKRDATFPQMFVANLGDGCKTTDNADLEFPNPGSELQKGSSAPAPPQGTCPEKTSVNLAGGATSDSGSSSSSSGSTPGNSTSGAPSGTAATPGTATILASPSPNAPAPAVSPSTPPLSGTNSTSASTGSAAPSEAPAAAGSKSCSSPGQMVCSADGTQFGICSSGSSVVMQPVATGTACRNGAITFAKAKRNSAKFYAGGWH